MTRVLLTGAGGFVGSHTPLSVRSAPKRPLPPPPLQAVQGLALGRNAVERQRHVAVPAQDAVEVKPQLGACQEVVHVPVLRPKARPVNLPVAVDVVDSQMLEMPIATEGTATAVALDDQQSLAYVSALPDLGVLSLTLGSAITLRVMSGLYGSPGFRVSLVPVTAIVAVILAILLGVGVRHTGYGTPTNPRRPA